MKKTFNENDYRLRVCSRDEIGQPWEDRWSMDDFVMNNCEMAQVGKPKNPQHPENPQQSQQEQFEQFEPLTKAERRRYVLELADKLLLMAHKNPDAFLNGNGPQLNKFLEQASRLDEKDDDKEKPLEKMSNDELKHCLLVSLGIIDIEGRPLPMPKAPRKSKRNDACKHESGT